MRILIACSAGLLRSVALAEELKLRQVGFDVVTIGLDFNSDEIKEKLYGWAEKIVVMETYMKNQIPHTHRNKVSVCDVGPDTFSSSRDQRVTVPVKEWVDANSDKLKEAVNIITYENAKDFHAKNTDKVHKGL